jgi:hypothetical protein
MDGAAKISAAPSNSVFLTSSNSPIRPLTIPLTDQCTGAGAVAGTALFPPKSTLGTSREPSDAWK